MLTDRRLSLNHGSMEMMVIIKINDYSWSESERDSIIEEATEKYLEKRRFTTMAKTPLSASSQASTLIERDERESRECDSDGSASDASAYSSCYSVEESDDDIKSDYAPRFESDMQDD